MAIVNETFAKTHFPGQDVIGQRVQTAGEPEAEVIGVVRDSRIDTIGEAPQSVIYFPFAQRPGRVIVHARTSVPPEAWCSTVARAIEDIDGTAPVSVQTLRGAASLELSMRRAGTVLAGSIGVVGLVLAMIGLYGVMAYVVASRTVEVAIRMALGASAGRVRREILAQVFGLLAAGAVIGGAASLGLAPAFQTFLVGVSGFDPVTFGAAVDSACNRRVGRGHRPGHSCVARASHARIEAAVSRGRVSVNKRSTIALVVVVVVAVALWLGGQALWNVILVMHGRR